MIRRPGYLHHPGPGRRRAAHSAARARAQRSPAMVTSNATRPGATIRSRVMVTAGGDSRLPGPDAERRDNDTAEDQREESPLNCEERNELHNYIFSVVSGNHRQPARLVMAQGCPSATSRRGGLRVDEGGVV